jgi:hypothetical protein
MLNKIRLKWLELKLRFTEDVAKRNRLDAAILTLKRKIKIKEVLK